MKIYAHTLVKNEARWVWYAVNSVINQVDRVLLWDTGSTDGTVEILKEIKRQNKNKIDLKLLKSVNTEEFTDVRQKMLDETDSDWFLVVDGDEIWWEDSINRIISEIEKNGKKIESIVSPTINLVGDVYHYQEKEAGHYNLAGKIGHYNIRAINRLVPGLASKNPHGTWGWIDESGKMIQDRDNQKVVFLKAPYLHASFLRRAGSINFESSVPKRAKKYKYELGESFALDYYYPEVFFKDRPEIVESVWERYDKNYFIRAAIETPLKKMRRRFFKIKEGY